MEFSESVQITDPVSGRKATVLLTDNEVHMLLSVGINTLLAQGLINLITQKDGATTVEVPESTLQ